MDKPPHASRHCRHYSYENTGLAGWQAGDKGGPLCARGVDLRAVPGSTIPCMPPAEPGARPLFRPCEPCALREDYTDAERSAWSAWCEESTLRMLAIVAAIPGDGFEGSLACPGCGGGTVRWVRARCNGHLHAACSTPDCFAVMQ